MKKLLLKTIRLYQKTLSPDHGYGRLLSRVAGCRFHPSCSQYMYEAVEKRGVIVGVGLGVWRILRCNPFSKGGIDEVKIVPKRGGRNASGIGHDRSDR